MKHNYYHNIGRFIGYYYGVSPVLSKYPEGDAGDYFLNGETCSLWMWDAASATWIDTNRVDSGLQQMLTDEERTKRETRRPTMCRRRRWG